MKESVLLFSSQKESEFKLCITQIRFMNEDEEEEDRA